MTDEPTRLRTLHALNVLDTPREPVFDRIARLAATICDTPIALVSLIDAERQWFKANVGLDGVTETPRAIAFCDRAIAGDDVFMVEDARADTRFAVNPLVTGSPHIRFYAGAPIQMPDGSALGTVCVIDRQARTLGTTQLAQLAELAALAREVLVARGAGHERLARTNAMLLRAEEIAQVGGWIADLANRSLTWTSGMAAIYGVPVDHAPDFDGHRRFFDEASNAVIDRAAQAAIQEGRSWDLQLPMRRLDGSQVWVRSMGHPEFESGRARRLVGTLQDITDLRQREASLAAANELLRAIVDNLPCGLSAFDDSLRMLIDNAEFKRLLDLPSTIYTGGRADFDRIIRYNADRGEYGPDADAAFDAIVTRARNPVPHAFHRVRPNGTVLDIRGAPLPSGGFVTTYMDVTAEATLRQALTRSEERLKRALDASRVVIWDYDVSTDTLFLSERWSELMGQPRSPMETTMSTLYSCIPEGERGAVQQAWLAALRGEATHFSCEHRVQAPGGQEIWFLAQGQVVERDSSGRAVRVTGANTDITRRKKMETELQQAKAAAEATNRAKSEFVATISHELRNPLHGVLTLLRLITTSDEPASAARYGHLAQTSAEAMLHLVNELLDDSKLQAGKMDLSPSTIDLEDLLDELQAVYQVRSREKGLHFAVIRARDLPRYVTLDGFRLRQVLQNLLSNAIKFTDTGEVRLAVSSKAAGTLIAKVTDTGIGMSEATCAALFEPYSQAEAATAERFGGTGLGLAISRQIARLMGGDITVSSRQGVGSRFVLQVPFVAGERPDGRRAADVPVSKMAVEARDGLVLVADDNDVNRFVARELLKRLGVQEVALVADGASAVERALALRPRVVLMDCQMPGVDGYSAARSLREQGFDAGIVAFTANGAADESRKCIEAGMDGTLGKPVDLAALRAVLDRWLPARPKPAELDFNAAALDERCVFSPGLAQKVVELFLASTEDDVASLLEQARAGDREAVMQLSHRIAGGAGTVGADRVRHEASGLESVAQRCDEPELMDRANKVASAFAGFRLAIHSHPQGG